MARGHPRFLTRLTVFFSQSLEVCSIVEGVIDRVCRLVCSFGRYATHLNLAIFHRVGQLNLCNKLDKVQRIVLRILNRTVHRANTHRVETCCNIARISFLAYGKTQIAYQRSALTHHVSRVGSLSKFFRIVGELLS